MCKKPDETLQAVAERIFESLAFVLLAIEEEQERPPSSDRARRTSACISFSGPFKGSLFVSVSDELVPTIAANMLGLDFGEVPGEDVQRDALKELVNVTCGNLLPELAGSEAVFNVAPAEILSDGAIPSAVDGRPPLATACLHLEDGWAELVLFAPEDIAVATAADG